MAVPVADDEALKAHPPLQGVRQQAAVAVVLDALPAGVRDQHRQGAGIDGGGIALGVQADQLGL